MLTGAGRTAGWLAAGQAAWGEPQRGRSQLTIRSYELGVWFGPSVVLPPRSSAPPFSCTPEQPLFSNVRTPHGNGGGLRPVPVGVTGSDGRRAWLAVPVPYQLPPVRYRPLDVPWAIDRVYTAPDSLGQTWPPSDAGGVHAVEL